MYSYYSPSYFPSFQYNAPYLLNQYFPLTFIPDYIATNCSPNPVLFAQQQKFQKIQEAAYNQRILQNLIQTTPSTRTNLKKDESRRKIEEKQIKNNVKTLAHYRKELKRLNIESNQFSLRVQTRFSKYKLRQRKNKNKYKLKNQQIKMLSKTKVIPEKQQIQKQTKENESKIQMQGNNIQLYEQNLQIYQCQIKPALIPEYITDMEQMRQFINRKRQKLISRLIQY